MHVEKSWIIEASRWALVFSGIVGMAFFFLLLVFGIIVGLAYFVEVLYR